MRIEQVSSAQGFQGLNIKKVAHEHRAFVRADIGKLKELGQQYDITLVSHINSDEYWDGIKITVKNLRKNLKFYQIFNRPKGCSYFDISAQKGANKDNITVLSQTEKAIEDLRKNTLLRIRGKQV